MKAKNSVLSIGFYDRTLCTRCGTCSGVCPTAAIFPTDDYYPQLIDDRCTECGLCDKTCPGLNVSFPELRVGVFGRSDDPPDYNGYYLSAYAAHSTNESVRNNGASGGVVTELLLFLLDSGRIDGAVVTVMERNRPERAKSIIATTPAEILDAQQSKYIVVPVNSILEEVKRFKGNLAYVGLPCQIHGLRKIQKVKPGLLKKIKVIIGLFCLTTFETPIISELNRIRGLKRKKLARFYFRRGTWPGNIVACYNDGSSKKLHYSNFKDGAINYLTKLYSPRRCQLCSDGSAEFADISVADAWMRRSDASYRFWANSTVLVRTTDGQKIFDDAINGNRITASEITPEAIYTTYRTLELNKKKFSQIRAEIRSKKGQIFPQYDEAVLSISNRERILERSVSLIHRVGESKVIRQLIIALLLSRIAQPFIMARKKRKEKRHHPEGKPGSTRL